jgi:hypothetical protein
MHLELLERERERGGGDWFIARQLFGSVTCIMRYENIGIEMIFGSGIFVIDIWTSLCP